MKTDGNMTMQNIATHNLVVISVHEDEVYAGGLCSECHRDQTSLAVNVFFEINIWIINIYSKYFFIIIKNLVQIFPTVGAVKMVWLELPDHSRQWKDLYLCINLYSFWWKWILYPTDEKTGLYINTGAVRADIVERQLLTH